MNSNRKRLWDMSYEEKVEYFADLIVQGYSVSMYHNMYGDVVRICQKKYGKNVRIVDITDEHTEIQATL